MSFTIVFPTKEFLFGKCHGRKNLWYGRGILTTGSEFLMNLDWQDAKILFHRIRQIYRPACNRHDVHSMTEFQDVRMDGQIIEQDERLAGTTVPANPDELPAKQRLATS